MAGRKNRAFLGGRERSSKVEFQRADVSKDEIETGLNKTVPRLLANAKNEAQFAPGWQLFSAAGVDFIEIGRSKIPYLSEARAEELIVLAEANCHAFDLAQHIAGLQIVALKVTGVDVCPSFTKFGAEILNGERTRPPQRGRPLSRDSHVKMWQYQLSKFLVATTTLHLTRNDASSGLENFSACDAVADAFSRAGQHTTYAQVKSVCFDASFKNIRKLADYLGLSEGF